MKTAAFFDFDGTLFGGTSGFDLLREYLRRYPITPSNRARLTFATIAYLGGVRNSWSTVGTLASVFRGVRQRELELLGAEAYSCRIEPRLRGGIVELLRLHQNKGDLIAVVSAATSYVVTPFARRFDIDHVACTELESVDGIVTGRLANCLWGRGKLDAAREFAARTGVSLEASHFYADSPDDLQLLDHVGYPHPVGNDRSLKRIARARHWKIIAV